jgi:hypothetical protein
LLNVPEPGGYIDSRERKMLGTKKARAKIDEKIIQPIQNAVIVAWAAICIALIALFAVCGSA